MTCRRAVMTEDRFGCVAAMRDGVELDNDRVQLFARWALVDAHGHVVYALAPSLSLSVVRRVQACRPEARDAVPAEAPRGHHYVVRRRMDGRQSLYAVPDTVFEVPPLRQGGRHA